MPRPILRALGALCAGVALVAFGLAVWLLPAVRSQAAALLATQSVDPTMRYCSTWDFLNNTGQDVDDLHVRLKSVKNVSDVYTGTLNPFGPPTTSVYSPTADVYELDFSGATVYDSDRVRIGLCTDSPLLRIGTDTSAFNWTSGGTPVSPNPLFTGLEWNWQKTGQLTIHVVNEQNMTVTLMALNLLETDNALSVDDLEGDVAAQLPLALELLPDPQTLAPYGFGDFSVSFKPAADVMPPDQAPLLETNHAYVVEAVVVDATDDGNTAHLYAQGLSPLARLSLPLVNR